MDRRAFIKNSAAASAIVALPLPSIGGASPGLAAYMGRTGESIGHSVVWHSSYKKWQHVFTKIINGEAYAAAFLSEQSGGEDKLLRQAKLAFERAEKTNG